MKNLDLESILIMNKAGLPMFNMDFRQNPTPLDPVLLSGFLTAISTFTQSILDPETRSFEIHYGVRTVTVITGKEVNLAAAHTFPDLKELLEVLADLLAHFEESYLPLVKMGDYASMVECEFKEQIIERIIEKTRVYDLSLDWIPVVMVEINDEDIAKSQLLTHVDNEKTIGQIIKETGTDEQDAMMDIARLWATRVIKFKGLLTPGDILIPTPRLMSFFKLDSTSREQLSTEVPEIAASLAAIARSLDGRTTIREVVKIHSDLDSEKIRELLNYLYDASALTTVETELRGIMVAKDCLDALLQVVGKEYETTQITDCLHGAVSKQCCPELQYQVKGTSTQWSIDHGLDPYERMGPNEIWEVQKKWVQLLKDLVNDLKPTPSPLLAMQIQDTIKKRVANRYEAADMASIEPFAQFLQTLVDD